MHIGDISTTGVIVTYPLQPLSEAARLMRDNHVGALVVLDPHDPARRPVGILTDRDIVRGQVSKGADLYCLTVDDVMSRAPLTVKHDMSLAEGIEAMNARGVRRAPVTDGNGVLFGIVTLDDLLPAVASELQALSQLLTARQHTSARAGRLKGAR